jgi:hypothetical protein
MLNAGPAAVTQAKLIVGNVESWQERVILAAFGSDGVGHAVTFGPEIADACRLVGIKPTRQQAAVLNAVFAEESPRSLIQRALRAALR